MECQKTCFMFITKIRKRYLRQPRHQIRMVNEEEEGKANLHIKRNQRTKPFSRPAGGICAGSIRIHNSSRMGTSVTEAGKGPLLQTESNLRLHANWKTVESRHSAVGPGVGVPPVLGGLIDHRGWGTMHFKTNWHSLWEVAMELYCVVCCVLRRVCHSIRCNSFSRSRIWPPFVCTKC